MIEPLKELLRAITDDDEVFSFAAKMLKKAYDALIAEGFTPEQATAIVAAQGTGVKLN